MPDSQGRYPTGKWVHDRANRILEEGGLASQYGDRAKSVAYALATQQAHKMGKTPKKGAGPGGMYGTKAGKATAKAKLDRPKKEYRKTASAWGRVMEKLGAIGGQDLRSFKPMTTPFPTDDSKGFAQKLLNQSKKATEVGPMPSLSKLQPKGPSIQDVSVKMPSTQGSLPKIGSAGGYIMDKIGEIISQDPLVQHMRKEAQKVTAVSEHLVSKGLQDTNDTLKALFSHPGKKKYTNKE